MSEHDYGDEHESEYDHSGVVTLHQANLTDKIVRGATVIYTDKTMKERDANDFYPTEDLHVFPILQILYDMGVRPRRILDPGAGAGVWGYWARDTWPDAEITGVELREDAPAHPAYDKWITGSYLYAPLLAGLGEYDLIIGNPPYKYAELFLRMNWGLMSAYAYMVQLLRIGFLAGINRQAGLYRYMMPNDVYIDSKRPSFSGDGRTDAIEYMFPVWNKAVRPGEFVGRMINVKHWQLRHCTEPYR